MKVQDLHRRAVQEFGRRVQAVSDDQWTLPTPCGDWNVRELVHHLVYECVWTPPILDGKTVDEVGDRFEGDLLGDDPKAAWDRASTDAVAAVGGPSAMERTVHLSFGDFPGAEYTMQLFSDHLIHAWDLARATGGEERLPPDLVDACATWFADHERFYRDAGVIGERPPIPDDADAQTRLLAAFGRAA